VNVSRLLHKSHETVIQNSLIILLIIKFCLYICIQLLNNIKYIALGKLIVLQFYQNKNEKFIDQSFSWVSPVRMKVK